VHKLKSAILVPSVFLLIIVNCSDSDSGLPVLTVELPLHLEEHIDAARIEGSRPGGDFLEPVLWDFKKAQPEWKLVNPLQPSFMPAQVTQINDALRLSIDENNDYPGRPFLMGSIYTDLPKWDPEHWDSILISLRTEGEIMALQLAFNIRSKLGSTPREQSPFVLFSDGCNVIKDGSIHTYMLKLGRDSWVPNVKLEQLLIMVAALKPAEADILSVRIKVPEEGQFDVGLGVLRSDIPIDFKITAIPRGGEEEPLLEETYADKDDWAQRSVDLSRFAGQTITLRLESASERAGSVSLWAAPTLSGKRATKKPNIILYVIDGASADYMSVYGYNRRTTPNIERLAAEGAVFEHAYSNATWTKVSNPSFMTSQYISILGGYKGESSQLPKEAKIMAQFMHDARYQTGVFSTNSYCGTMSGFDKGVDWLREKWTSSNFISARELHKDFWVWREAHPGEPFWVHFQTTDLHWPWEPEAPFAGLFLSPESRQRYFRWEREAAKAAGLSRPTWPSPRRIPSDAFKKAGINHLEYFENARCLYL
jgi:hypothetical protein